MNLILPTSQDYKIMGKLGILKMTSEIASAACRKRNKLYGNPFESRFRNSKKWKYNKEVCRKNGQKAGRKTVESGRIYKMIELAAKANKGKPKPSSKKWGQFTKQHKIGIFGMTAEEKTLACKKGGQIAGKINGKKRMQSLTLEQRSAYAKYMNTFKTREQQIKAGFIGAHKRYHVPQNTVNPKCFLCIARMENI